MVLGSLPLDHKYNIRYYTHMDYDTRLANLYNNRSLLIFTHGRDWFVNQANRLFAYSESSLQPGMDPATHAYLNSRDFYRHCWETENGYDRTEDCFQ